MAWQKADVWDPAESVGPSGGGWTSLGLGETEGSRLKSPLSRFGTWCHSSLVGKFWSCLTPVGVVSWSYSPSKRRDRDAGDKTGKDSLSVSLRFPLCRMGIRIIKPQDRCGDIR